MKNKFFICLIILIHQMKFILNEEGNTSSSSEKTDRFHFNAVFRIDSLINKLSLTVENNHIKFTYKKEGKEQNFRIISTEKNSSLYFIESKPYNKRLALNTTNLIELILLDKNNSLDIKETYWNIIELNNKEFLIQNNYTKKFIEFQEQDVNNIYPGCSKSLIDITNNNTVLLNDVQNYFKFSFFKLYEEVEIKDEHIKFIDKEPVDVVIKYIDLTDTTLNREGIVQKKKDVDNEELKYSVRSILENIPWIRKIFILMPNEKVKYFKPINEIKDKIVYVKDRDLLGFDSADSHVFHFNLFNMTQFGLSENFILMDDDYFFGKPIKKSQFFYYDEIQNKVLPSIVVSEFSELNRRETLGEYNLLFRRSYSIKPFTYSCWKFQQLSSFKLLLELYPSPLINVSFSHNAIPLNTNDLKEIYELVKNNYQHPNEALYAKTRSILGLQTHTLFNSYALNIKKRKVNTIPSTYFDIGDLADKDLNIEMFVINTSGDRQYTQKDYDISKLILGNKFNKPTPYEIIPKNKENKKKISKNDKLKELRKQIDAMMKERNNSNISINYINHKAKDRNNNDSIISFVFVILLFLIIIFAYLFNFVYYFRANNSQVTEYTVYKKSKRSYSDEEFNFK